jgi:hypothetical protein
MQDKRRSMSLETASTPASERAAVFRLSPLIRLTLMSLYVALTVPLPFLAIATDAPLSPWLFVGGGLVGAIALYAALCERVVLTETSISVTYPGWVPRFFRRGWSLNWDAIADLKPRTTGQGGLVYYFVTPKRDRAYLLPMRVAGFAELTRQIQAKTHLDMSDVRPLSQPWMYLILLGFTLLLLLVDAWTITTAVTGGLVQLS